jgi:hypothetical protein
LLYRTEDAGYKAYPPFLYFHPSKSEVFVDKLSYFLGLALLLIVVAVVILLIWKIQTTRRIKWLENATFEQRLVKLRVDLADLIQTSVNTTSYQGRLPLEYSFNSREKVVSPPGIPGTVIIIYKIQNTRSGATVKTKFLSIECIDTDGDQIRSLFAIWVHPLANQSLQPYRTYSAWEWVKFGWPFVERLIMRPSISIADNNVEDRSPQPAA